LGIVSILDFGLLFVFFPFLAGLVFLYLIDLFSRINIIIPSMVVWGEGFLEKQYPYTNFEWFAPIVD
jgi:hypothetical protein